MTGSWSPRVNGWMQHVPIFAPAIRLADFDDPQIVALLQKHLEDAHANSPPGHVFALDLAGLKRPEITFTAAWHDETLLGFGALKELAPDHGELKSMRTASAHLRKGVAQAILDHLIATARLRGYTRVSLETGSGTAFEPALALYRRNGFVEGGAFADYVKNSFCQFFHLDLQ